MTRAGPRVTIGMPVFENARTLARAIASVQAQTVADWKLIVTDDGSGDDGPAIAAQAAAGDPRICVTVNDHRLGHMNFRVPLDRARTPYFVWLAADDFWAPGFLEAALARAEARPDAVSVLPRWRYSGADAMRTAPRTPPLEGPWRDRVQRFLAAPGGTRMYGLCRTEALRRAFPRRDFHAYDWYLVLGLLRQGPIAEVPGPPLLFRERTPPGAYPAAAEAQHRGLLRSFPALAMSLAALASGLVPPANLGDLARLNARKHEEFLAHRRPSRFARRLPVFQWLGLPISTEAGRAAAIAEEIVRTDPTRRAAAGAMLEALSDRGDAAAALTLGYLRAEGLLQGDPETAFRRAAGLGNPDARFQVAMSERNEEDEGTAFWAEVVDAAAAGSGNAVAWLARERDGGRLPAILHPVLDRRLATQLERRAP